MSRAVSHPQSFLWHDYETFGTRPAYDRPVQFAAVRTDANLEIQGEAHLWYARPANDFLPHPFACLVTGITPQEALEKGITEARFAANINELMSESGTCSVGYNSMRFDDEVSRYLFYRNLMDPYAREWKNGNSRWDLIGLTRMCYALRPEGIQWPARRDDSGLPSFRLEDLTAANEIDHQGAHDARADVMATISLARLLKRSQPRLFDWALKLRDKSQVNRLVNPMDPRPLVHTSGRIPASRGCTTLVLPLATVPDRRNEVVVIDLMSPVGTLLDLTVDQIRDRVFTATADLPEGVDRIPLKKITANKSPMVAPMGVLKGVDQERIGLDQQRALAHANELMPHLQELRAKLMEVFLPVPFQASGDPDDMLYSGGFFSRQDRSMMDRMLLMKPEELATLDAEFDDTRLPEMVFRYRARNWPESLNAKENERWEKFRRDRLEQPSLEGLLGIEGFNQELAQARTAHSQSADAQQLLDQVEDWARRLMP